MFSSLLSDCQSISGRVDTRMSALLASGGDAVDLPGVQAEGQEEAASAADANGDSVARKKLAYLREQPVILHPL